MFTIEQINDLHTGLGNGRTLLENVLALKGLGVERYYLAEGHSEYIGQGRPAGSSPHVHEVLPVAETGQCETMTMTFYDKAGGEMLVEQIK
jgi:hypothetical protein